MTTQGKVYQNILQKIKAIIYNDGLQTGDKLPSERELSDRLNAGRSSIREALRSMEMLGLIETRRGEGTFIANARDHRLVEVIASFILKDTKSKEDLLETRKLIEKDILRVACERISDEYIDRLRTMMEHKDNSSDRDIFSTEFDTAFFRVIVSSTHNHLLMRLWSELADYHQTIWHQLTFRPTHYYEAMIQALASRNQEAAINLLDKYEMKKTEE
ncbi:FadR/GntR family transcriptional regulator [Pseudalkalibacillus hwajinpoensis]|uniref:FadR/GntR family transcriptional regulator n=1 Tax=Guptibacillus hwajinpoensis TaxID=208199 RepID=UPI001CD431B8|nr:FadR/GntR family transcriptional regulator [Pseudalkalibacillus hwajinpoensis]MCA0992440.1 FadR family transcriptional regulator [Pseudalkalibacillus hwajinpoensis]